MAACDLCGWQEAAFVFKKNGYQLHRCTRCEMVYVANPPDPESIARLYSAEAGYHLDYEGQSVRNKYAAERLAWIERSPPKGRRLLEIGCSTGHFLVAAREAGWRVTGLEISKDTARIARERHGLDVQVGDFLAFDPCEQFDVIAMWDVIEHVRSPRAFLRRARELLSPGGQLVIETPNIDGLFPQLSYKLSHILGFWQHPEPPGHLFQFSQRTLSAALEKSGLRADEVRHRAISCDYLFGEGRAKFRSVGWGLYSLAMMPVALLGPMVGAGDALRVRAICN